MRAVDGLNKEYMTLFEKIFFPSGYGGKEVQKMAILPILNIFYGGPLFFIFSYFTDMYTIRSEEIHQKCFQIPQKITFPMIYST